MKILGIGLGRTGTRSLYLALEILGYKTKHCPGFFLDSNGKLKVEEDLFRDYDAATDEPCILIYNKEIPSVPFPKTNVFGVSDFATLMKKKAQQTNATGKLRC